MSSYHDPLATSNHLAATRLVVLIRQLSESDLCAADKQLMIALLLHSSGQGFCWPGIARLCQLSSLSRPTVFRRLAHLESIGLVRRLWSGRGRKANTYSIKLDRLESQTSHHETLNVSP